MAATKMIISVKGEAKLAKGTLTVPNMAFNATDAQIKATVVAAVQLHAEALDEVYRVEKSRLI